jgi:hypothetical protein
MNSEYDIRGKKVNRSALEDEAKRIVDSVRYTDYRHREEVDESTGTYIMDCSGFISYILKRVAPEHLGVIPKEIDKRGPGPDDFYEYFSTLTTKAERWRPIHCLDDVLGGDIMVWRHEGRIKPHDDTGHVLMVAEMPTAQADGIYSVRVYDSSNLPHNDDTRRDGVTGVGGGEIKFKVDSRRKPTSVQFTVGESFESCSIAVGRAEPVSDVAPNWPAFFEKQLKEAKDELGEAQQHHERALKERAQLEEQLKQAKEQLNQAQRDRDQALNERAELEEQLKQAKRSTGPGSAASREEIDEKLSFKRFSERKVMNSAL